MIKTTAVSFFVMLLSAAYAEVTDSGVIANCFKMSDIKDDVGHDYCQTCQDGYYDSNNGYVCSPCTLPCKTCYKSATICKSCDTGFLFNPTSFTCSACVDGCANCTSTSSCIACKPFYFLSKDKTRCNPCSASCRQCSSSTLCEICDDLFILKSYKGQTICVLAEDSKIKTVIILSTLGLMWFIMVVLCFYTHRNSVQSEAAVRSIGALIEGLLFAAEPHKEEGKTHH